MANDIIKAVHPARRVDLDFIRTLSFTLVFIYHFMLEMEDKGVFDFSGRGLFYENANCHMASLGVGLFFMISGAGLMLSAGEKLDCKTYFSRRFFRVLLPFYIAYAGCFIILLVSGRSLPFENGTAPWTVIFTILGMDEYFSLWGISDFSLGIGEWFLGCLMLIYLIYPLLWQMMKKHRRIFITAATVYYLLLVYFYPFSVPALNNVLTKLYEFILGMYILAEWTERKMDDSRKRYPVGLCALAIILLFILLPVSLPLPEDLKVTLLSTAVMLLFMSGESMLSASGPLKSCLALICRYTFEIYLVHHVIIYQFALWLGGRNLSGFQMLLWGLLDILVTAAAGIGLHFICRWTEKKIKSKFLQQKPQ